MNTDKRKEMPGGDAGLDQQIESLMDRLTVEKAPASLSRRLKRIPREESRREKGSWWIFPRQTPRWVMAPAFAVIPLLVAVIFLMQPKQPTAAEIEQARQEVAVAFAYLDKVGYLTGSQIHDVLGGELRRGVKKPLSENIPFTEQSRKEETT